VKKGFAPVVISLVIVAAMRGQSRPAGWCVAYSGFGANPNLMEVGDTRSTTGYFGCARDGSGCLSKRLAPGTPVVIAFSDGDWTCGYAPGPVWIPSADLRPLNFDLSPPLKAWVGTWIGGEDRVVISLSKVPGKLSLEGTAHWHGARGVVHDGEFNGQVEPDGNHLHFAEGRPLAWGCVVDLTLFGKYIVADDNERCGGMNVRFYGIWKRAA
jgi:hypothetical protein